MENEPKPKGERRLYAVEVEISDMVLEGLKEQLEKQVISTDEYKERKAAYIAARYPDIPNIVA